MRAIFLAALLAVGCSGPTSSIEILDARSMFLGDGSHKVVVVIDLRGHDQLGGNIGHYCTTVTFATQVNAAEFCYDDLSDGDQRTIRIVSDIDLPDSDGIAITVRLNDVDAGRSLIGPVFPK